ncbi:orotidine-5'-phosphate decarboxylase [Marivibrio halodurans]|uniref:Orotidine 5'-phosphate decarboxylase n=1 Tax=Marivibrio halodurans TaxID=2039722 RepID=A0A8J7S0S4_9PROT|nr:orotidine-5'-phosphate decarboxylase [Marivibrio halodurans]MBP5858227.1 orotidine-5'-phosphate decarboxylase [Marivibrio halodurans]
MTEPAPTPRRPQDRILVAIDTAEEARAVDLSRGLAGAVGGIKLGLEFFNAHGPEGVRRVTRATPEETPRGQAPVQQRLFLDLKFHDIPNTVAGAVRGAMQLGPAILNVHAAGGPAMMTAARQAADFQADSLGIVRPMLIAVTVLTSLDDDDLTATGQQGPAAEQVVRLARLTQSCGLDGVVCSAHEITAIRAACGPDFKLIVPGIRPAGAQTGDQKRTMTPGEAVASGADFLVIGRPITGAPNPAEAAAAIAAEIAA